MRQSLLGLGLGLVLSVISPGVSVASPNDLGVIIESFVTRHFPDALSHMWIVNSTQWDGDEMVVDVNTYVVEKQRPDTIENRYLLLIVEGKLAAAQRVPLEGGPECQTEDAQT